MSLKNWMLGRMNRVLTRADLPPREAALHTVGDVGAALREPSPARGPAARTAPGLEHLGSYRPLIAAIRAELERFVATELRLHLAIAEQDRYVLTAIAVESRGHDDTRQRLLRFTREFSPEQVKHYLARDIIARLPNASAIDLRQFAGLDLSAEQGGGGADTAFDDLLAELRSDEPEAAQPYVVTLVGRWSDTGRQDADAPPERALPAGAKPSATRPRAPSPATPLAGRQVVVDVEDAGGLRQVSLPAVVPGRRYVIGKDAACDIVVDGAYASRRHCEIWQDGDTWFVTDCGSTNGVRVEPAVVGVLRRPAMLSSAGGDGKALAVTPGAHIVLSAAAQGDAAHYPRIALRPPAVASVATAATPVTPIVAPLSAPPALTVTLRMATGERALPLPPDAPLTVGRSRSQRLVVDWAHEGVSGHHIDVEAPDATGARVRVHGDNGVRVNGVAHERGATFHWDTGTTLQLGRPVPGEPECTLELTRAS